MYLRKNTSVQYMLFYEESTKFLPRNQNTDILTSKISFILLYYCRESGLAVAQLVETHGLQAGRSCVLFPMMSLKFFIDTILPAALWPWV